MKKLYIKSLLHIANFERCITISLLSQETYLLMLSNVPKIITLTGRKARN